MSGLSYSPFLILGGLFWALSILTGAFTTYLVLLTIYRLTFHPLAKYPGPFIAKITDWYSVYHAWKGDRHLEFWRCHEKYGPVFRYGPDSLSFNTNSALKTIYGHKSNVKKSQFYSVFPPTKDTWNTHNSIDKTNHARKRRVLSHAFSDSAIRSMEKYIMGNVRTFCDKLFQAKSPEKKCDGWGIPQNMSDWCNYLAFDVMGDLCFGKAFEMLEHEKNHHVIDLIGNAAHTHLITGTYPMIKNTGLSKILFRKIYAQRMKYMAYSKAQATERTKIGLDTDRKDFFYYLLNARDAETGHGFTTPELWGESNLLIIAGSDTTSTALAAAFFYLVHNPEKLEILAKEINATFEDVEDIHSSPMLNNCTYLRAVIDEAMRMSPPVGGLLPREVMTGGLDVDGIHIPAGYVVGVPHYGIHHNEEYYPDPFSFVPERWIPDGSQGRKINVELAQSAFCPFSVGPRGCIGKGVAYVELMTSLARVVWLYEMRLSEGREMGASGLGKQLKFVGGGKEGEELGRRRMGEFQLRDCFTSLKNGPWVEFKKREGGR